MNESKLIQKLANDLKAEPHHSGTGYTAICPFHDDHNSSLYFSENGFICLSCGKTGTLEELSHVETQAVVEEIA